LSGSAAWARVQQVCTDLLAKGTPGVAFFATPGVPTAGLEELGWSLSNRRGLANGRDERYSQALSTDSLVASLNAN